MHTGSPALGSRKLFALRSMRRDDTRIPEDENIMSKNQTTNAKGKPDIAPDKPTVLTGSIPEDGSHCPCCRLPFSDDRVPYINICATCADRCGEKEHCQRNRCNICGEGFPEVTFNFTGQAPREACAGCAVICIQKGIG